MLLVAIDEVKEFLDMEGSKNDAELRAFIDSVMPVVEDYVGIIEPRTFTERHYSGDCLRLRHGPALSVLSIADWLTDTILYYPVSLKLDTETGTIYLKDGTSFLRGPYMVSYQAGRTVVAGNIRTAAKMIVGHNWKTQRGALVRFPGSDETALPPGFTYSVPRKALEYMRSEMRNKVVVA